MTIENGVKACPLPLSEFDRIWRGNAMLLPALADAYANQKVMTYSGEPRPLVPGEFYAAGVNEYLTLRDKPATSGKALRKLPADMMLELIEIANDEFCRVRTLDTGEEGYVMSKYLY